MAGEREANGADGRIRVLRGNALVPLLPVQARGALPRVQPWRGLLLERHTVGAVEIPEHEHRELCLHLQLKGAPELEWWNEGKNRVEQTGPGFLILLGAGTRDRLRWGDESERLVLSVQPDLLRQAAGEPGAGSSQAGPEFRNQWALRDPALANELMQMAAQADEGWPLGTLYADLLAVRLAGLLVRRHGEATVGKTKGRGGLPFPALRRAMEFMTDNLHRDLSLEEIAAQAELSAFHFVRQFRLAAGESPYRYLLAQRLARAQQLLRGGTMPIAEVARETGWNSPVNFARAFRQSTGMTPGAWRQSA